MTRRSLFASLVAAAGSAAEERSTRISATLKRAPGPWWKQAIPGGEPDGTLVSWGIGLYGANSKVPQNLPASTQCQKDPFCTDWTQISRQCNELYAHGHPRWDSRYSCYAANRTLFFDQEQEIFASDLPADIRKVRISFYDRDDSFRRRQWESSQVVVRFTDDISRIEASVELLAGPGGEPRGLRVACLPTSTNPAALSQRMRVGEFQHCSVEPNNPHLPQP